MNNLQVVFMPNDFHKNFLKLDNCFRAANIGFSMKYKGMPACLRVESFSIQ